MKHKPQPYIAPYSDVPLTKDDLDKRQRKYYRLKKDRREPNSYSR